MSFVSVTFVVFLVAVFGLYWALGGKRRQWQNALLLVASLVFYGWVEWQLTGLLLLAGLSSWAAGRVIGHAPDKPSASLAFWSAIVLNLGILGLFKYFNFFADNFAAVFTAMGWRVDAVTLRLVLPVGISFYTFQAVAYVVDVRRRTVEACRNVIDYLAFLCFFPQLVAGPIERATSLLPQMRTRRTFDSALAVDGLRQMLWGFVKKVVVADSCGVIVDQVWHNPAAAGMPQLWLASLLFAMQIYADFSGYSDIAIGCGKLFGIRLRRNFDTPFFATNMARLWRRWHMSLMEWFRDYVYIPLGGSRHGQIRRAVNILIVFLLSGLWHGAAWTFVLWGLFNGVLVLLSKRAKQSSADFRAADLLLMFVTTMLFALTFVAFRAPSTVEAFRYYHLMLTPSWVMPYGWHALAYAMAMLAVEWVSRRRAHGLQIIGHGALAYAPVRWLMYYALVMTVIVFYLSSEQVAFIYFRF